jgi:hypothetical protein
LRKTRRQMEIGTCRSSALWAVAWVSAACVDASFSDELRRSRRDRQLQRNAANEHERVILSILKHGRNLRASPKAGCRDFQGLRSRAGTTRRPAGRPSPLAGRLSRRRSRRRCDRTGEGRHAEHLDLAVLTLSAVRVAEGEGGQCDPPSRAESAKIASRSPSLAIFSCSGLPGRFTSPVCRGVDWRRQDAGRSRQADRWSPKHAIEAPCVKRKPLTTRAGLRCDRGQALGSTVIATPACDAARIGPPTVSQAAFRRRGACRALRQCGWSRSLRRG